MDPTNSAYWLYKTIQVLLEGKQKDWQPKLCKFQYECQSMAVHHVDVTDEQAQEVDSSDLPDFLTAANSEIAEAISQVLNAAGILTFTFKSESIESAVKALEVVFTELRQDDRVASEYIVFTGYGEAG